MTRSARPRSKQYDAEAIAHHYDVSRVPSLSRVPGGGVALLPSPYTTPVAV